jgi:hypothetical protein
MLLMFAIQLGAASAASTPRDIALIRARLTASLVAGAAADALSTSTTLAAELNVSGLWSDIDYYPPHAQNTRSHWPPLEHMSRVVAMASCAAAARPPSGGDAPPALSCAQGGGAAVRAVAGAATRALRWWLHGGLINPDNWYMTRISSPLDVGRAVMLLQPLPNSTISASDLAAARSLISAANWSTNPPGMVNVTGANLLWMATARVLDGIARSDGAVVDLAVARIWEELATTGGNSAGIKRDASFFQHDEGEFFMYRYISRESCSQFDSLPLTSLKGADRTTASTDRSASSTAGATARASRSTFSTGSPRVRTRRSLCATRATPRSPASSSQDKSLSWCQAGLSIQAPPRRPRDARSSGSSRAKGASCRGRTRS